MKQTALLLVVLFFSCSLYANDQIPNCRSWWSGPDNVRHCLMSGNWDKETSVDVPVQKEENKENVIPQEEIFPNPDDISAPNNSPNGPSSGIYIIDTPLR